MSTATVPNPASSGIRSQVLVRWGFLAFLLGGSLWMVLDNLRFRMLEAWVTAGLVPLVTSGPATSDSFRAVVFFGLGTPDVAAIEITPECTTALLFLPLVLIAAVMSLGNRISVGKALAALGIGGLVLFGFNQIRLVLIAWAMTEYGEAGYGWSHTIGGSVISIVGVAIAMVVFFLVATRLKRSARS